LRGRKEPVNQGFVVSRRTPSLVLWAFYLAVPKWEGIRRKGKEMKSVEEILAPLVDYAKERGILDRIARERELNKVRKNRRGSGSESCDKGKRVK